MDGGIFGLMPQVNLILYQIISEFEKRNVSHQFYKKNKCSVVLSGYLNVASDVNKTLIKYRDAILSIDVKCQIFVFNGLNGRKVCFFST